MKEYIKALFVHDSIEQGAIDMSLEKSELFQTKAFINGQWLNATNKDTFPVYNPYDKSLIAEVADLDISDCELAIEAAFGAQKTWKLRPAKERASLLMRLYDLMIEHKSDLAQLLTLEQGKVLKEAQGEIIYGANYIKWFAEEALRINGKIIPALSKNHEIRVYHEPVGVVTAITPWNFPNAMIARKMAPALAAGCSFVVKPSEETPLSALAIAKLVKEAGFPDGLFNVVTGTNSEVIGDALILPKEVAKFTFTGSTSVGKKLQAKCALGMKRSSMELGGNAPFIVFEDADIPKVIAGTMISKFRNAGQTCVCSNRFLVHESIEDAFKDALLVAMKSLKSGNGLTDCMSLGPMINQQTVHKVEGLIQSAIEAGARLVYQADKVGNEFVPPTLIDQVTADMAISTTEIFGPVVAIQTFTDEAEAIRLANDTPFGLAAYFYTHDATRIHRVSRDLEYGIIGVNEGSISNEMAPFGGVKESGQGREGSSDGILDYVDVKYICQNFA
ncbi:MAG: NAD-dependent succinate-semialdehyde dehydrogenase [Lentisphaeria bacterium]|nr:NAD-dependent succinate-semialdehyde dehydrogenase [Lentisphaeria bacterium]